MLIQLQREKRVRTRPTLCVRPTVGTTLFTLRQSNIFRVRGIVLLVDFACSLLSLCSKLGNDPVSHPTTLADSRITIPPPPPVCHVTVREASQYCYSSAPKHLLTIPSMSPAQLNRDPSLTPPPHPGGTLISSMVFYVLLSTHEYLVSYGSNIP